MRWWWVGLPRLYSISAHSKTPPVQVSSKRRWRLQYTVAAGGELGFRKKHYVMGNHEDRLDRYIQDRAPEMNGDCQFVMGCCNSQSTNGSFPVQRPHHDREVVCDARRGEAGPQRSRMPLIRIRTIS